MSLKVDYPTYLMIIQVISKLKPVSLSYMMAAFFGAHLSPILSEKSTVYGNFQNCLSSDVDLDSSWESYLKNSAVNALSATLYSKMNPHWLDRNISLSGLEYLQDAYNSGNGVLLLTGHQHQLVLLCVAIGLLGFKVDLILFHPEKDMPDFQKIFLRRLLMDSSAHFNGGQYLFVDLESNNIRSSILQSLKSGHVVVAACDFPPELMPGKAKRRAVIPFFQQQLSCPIGSIEIAKKNKAKFVSGFIRWHGGSKFALSIKPLEASQNSTGIISQFGEHLESALASDPGGWGGWQWTSLIHR